MKANKILLITGATLAGAAIARYVYRNILLANEWDFNVTGFRINRLIPQAEGVVTIEFINKSNFTATIKDIDLTVLSQDVKVGSITESKETTIVPNGKSPLSFTINFDPKSLISGWRTLAANALTLKDFPLDFVGNFKIKTIFGFTKVPVRYSTSGKELKSLYDEYYG